MKKELCSEMSHRTNWATPPSHRLHVQDRPPQAMIDMRSSFVFFIVTWCIIAHDGK